MLVIAMAFNMIHLMYRQLTLHFDLYPLNNFYAISSKRRMFKSIKDGILMLFPLIALRIGNSLLIEIALGILVLLLTSEFVTWWLPYLTRPSKEWQAQYQQVFHETLKVLPRIRDNPIPNLDHCILHLLTLLSLFSTIFYYASK